MYKEYFEKYKTTKDYRKAEISEYYIMLQDMASMLLADEEFFIFESMLNSEISRVFEEGFKAGFEAGKSVKAEVRNKNKNKK